MSREVCEQCREGNHSRCEGFLFDGNPCACKVTADCGANAPDKEKK